MTFRLPRKKQPPAYQMYATDVMATKEFRMMNLAQRGLFITLHLDTWANDEVPYDNINLARYLGFPHEEIVKARSDNLYQFFQQNGEYFICPEHEAYKAQLEERREKQSAGGKKGQRIKKAKAKGSPLSDVEGSRVEMDRIESNRLEVSRVERMRAESPLTDEEKESILKQERETYSSLDQDDDIPF